MSEYINLLKGKVARCAQGAPEIFSGDQLDMLIDADLMPDWFVTMPNPNRVGTLDAYLGGHFRLCKEISDERKRLGFNEHEESGVEIKRYVNEDGVSVVEHRKDGAYHCEDGPAITQDYVTNHNHFLSAPGQNVHSEFWYRDGELDRDDGPAVHMEGINEIGDVVLIVEEWRQNGLLHRTDGPAVKTFENPQGGDQGEIVEEWWVNGEQLTEDDFLKRFPAQTDLESSPEKEDDCLRE